MLLRDSYSNLFNSTMQTTILRHIASLIIFTAISLCGAASLNAASHPDFAYPKKVTANAEKQLSAARASGNDIAAIRALMDIALAQQAIGNEKLLPIVNRISEFRDSSSAPSTRAILNLLLADIYSDIYQAGKYKYDRRDLPAHPYPADYNEWSGLQFRIRIDSLCSAALSDFEALQKKSITDYSSIISTSRATLPTFPTLYDFVADFTIRLRKRLTPFSNLFSTAYLSPARAFIASPKLVPGSATATAVLDTYAQWLKFHEKDIAPFINVDLMRLNTVALGSYHSLSQNASKEYIKALRDLFLKYSDSEYSGDILLAIYEQYLRYSDLQTSDADTRWLYSAIKSNISRFQAYHRISCLKNALDALSAESFTVEVPTAIVPDNEFPLHISGRNCQNIIIDIYRLTDLSYSKSTNVRFVRKSNDFQLIKSISLPLPKSIPFSVDTVLHTSLDAEGIYIAVPRKNTYREYYSKIYCSSLALACQRIDNHALIALNPLSGAPIPDADIMIMQRNNRSDSWTRKGATDANGFFDLTGSGAVNAIATKGSDRFSRPIHVYIPEPVTSTTDTIAAVYTDLAIYHPGDSVSWATILYSVDGNSRRLLASQQITATLYNANGVKSASAQSITDRYGRATGSLLIPEGELTGNYRIAISTSENNSFCGTVRFMVSDYKLPTFKVEAKDIVKNSPKNGYVTVSGRAVTYSDMPVSDAAVRLDLSGAQRQWWRMSNAVSFYSAEATTDSNGRFSITIPDEVFEASPAPHGVFSARIEVTSDSGESQQASASFSLGSEYEIIASIPSDIDVSTVTRLDVKVINTAGLSVDKSVEYCILANDSDSIVCRGSFNTRLPEVNWSDIAGGLYDIRFYLPSETDSVTINSVALYRPSDKRPPIDSPVWAPTGAASIVECNDKGEATFIFGTSAPETHVLLTLSSSGHIIQQRWLKKPPGIHKLLINTPFTTYRATLTLSATYNLKSSTGSITIINPAKEKRLDIITESFRDHITPGSGETWTFRTVNRDSVGTPSAIMFDMYNAALDALSPAQWRFNPRTLPTLHYSFTAPNLGLRAHASFFANRRHLSCDDISQPAFALYGRSFNPHTAYVERSSVTLLGSSRNAKMATVANTDTAVEESVAEAAETTISDETDNGTSSEIPTALFNYRDSEVPLAFFRPMLATDADGLLSFRFTAPNANTTWKFNAIAFTDSLETAEFSASVIANKPIMIQPNLPRYLRIGDSAEVRASVMNNSDSAVSVVTTVEIFDPLDSRIISSGDTTMTIPSHQSAVVTTIVPTQQDSPFIGYRIKSTSGLFSDGEQSLIPLLPFTTPVISTTPFYFGPDSTSLSLSLPPMKPDASVTLQFCENPIWYVVTALPGLSTDQPTTAPDAARAIFSTAIAEKLLHDYPVIADAIRSWTASDRSDSTLVSMLQQNSELKYLFLKSTPWMLDAASDTERMQRLALLFDPQRIAASYSECIAKLRQLRCADGGFAWSSFYSDESSLWATTTVMKLLGRLNSLSSLPDNSELQSLISPALSMIESETAKLYRTTPKADYTDFSALLSLWPDHRRTATSERIVATTVQRAASSWKKFDIHRKAEAAILLANNHYTSTARQILRSIREYAETSPTKGMWWPSVDDSYSSTLQQLSTSAVALEAFAKIEPQSIYIDAIRQWLILQKETLNWGKSSIASDIIASLITTSPQWISTASDATITTDSDTIAVTDRYFGYIKTSLQPTSHISIYRRSDTPAYGAVYCRYTDYITNVQPQSCEAASIEKHIYRQHNGEWTETDSLAVGNRVRIELTVRTSRPLSYVTISDDRAACLKPIEQLPTPLISEGIRFYRENLDSSTRIFVTDLPRGSYRLTYDMWVNNAGSFTSGIATIQSQYAPQITAHSGGSILTAM